MDAAKKIGIKAVALTSSTVNLAIMVVIMLLLVFGGYALWDSHQVYAVASSTQYAAYKPTDKNGGLSFKELQAINPEVISWLTVYGTHIDYPVAQSTNNLKYINTDATGKYSLSGSLFLDAGCSPDFSDFSSIIYGHHMDEDTMFGEIGLFANQSYFNARKYGVLYFDGKEHGLEFFEFIHVDAYDDAVYRTKITGRDAQQAYLDLLKSEAKYTRSDVPVTPDDHIVLLSTCSETTTNGRDILLAKITDKVPADPFGGSAGNRGTGIPALDSLLDLWDAAPLPVKIVIIALPFLLVLLLIVLIIKKKKRPKEAHAEDTHKGDE
ncbi:MAG: class B sortase [Coriobacteriia bacterium]|nr:class B sortase [Coriobacteriia bacterium]